MSAVILTYDVCFQHRRVLSRLVTRSGVRIDVCKACLTEQSFVMGALDSITGSSQPLVTHTPPRDLPAGVRL